MGLVLLSACQGDRVAESWFAPDPQLQAERSRPRAEETTEPTPTETETETETTSDSPGEEDVRLPQTFPAEVPTYPQARLVASSYRFGQGTGTTDWASRASPRQVANFYQQFLADKDWQIEQRFTASTPETILVKGEQEVRISFPTEGQFRLAYRDTAQAAEEATPPDSPMAPTAPTTPTAQGGAADLVALGVIPADFDPNAVMNRRTFARWLFTAHNRIYRDRATQQIRPANPNSQPAFQDIPQSDPDFATIQGLAEAGIIPSRLTGETAALLFRPEAPLTRETLILWKVPLDRRTTLPTATLQNIQQVWGFQDSDQISPNVLPALLVDYENGDQANILRSFGYTKLLQPKKSVTQEEAAIALSSFGFQSEAISAAEALQLDTETESEPITEN
jgi:hypothetical protein